MNAKKEILSVKNTNGGISLNWQTMILLISQICVLAWGAATMTSGLNSVKEALAEVRGVAQRLSEQAVNNAVRIGVVESKVDDLRDEIRALKPTSRKY